MKRILFAMSFVAATVVLPGDVCSAGRRGRIFRRPLHSLTHCAPQSARRVHRYNPYDYYRALHPKYYGGFHASFLHDYGVPSGDIGLRGNGIYWTPW
jgi:hypothetical protein